MYTRISLRHVWMPLLSMILPLSAHGQICGCAGSPDSLGNFNTADPATYPPGTTTVGSTITIPLPDDGVLIFDSFNLDRMPNTAFATVRFETSGTTRRNPPVTLLIAGDANVGGTLDLNGSAGSRGDIGGTTSQAGAGGPGGYRGGDGAYQAVDPEQRDTGGYGFGPGGGVPGDPAAGGTGAGIGGSGIFLGSADLLPLIGGGGGGGGNSRDVAGNCGGGGGGGGGGALLMAVDGTLTVNGTVRANGGGGGFVNTSCASAGGGGGGGSIRLIADTIIRTTGGNGITATGGNSGTGGITAGSGVIRLEAFTDNVAVGASNPLAFRPGVPGPLVSPILQAVGITAVGGATVSARNGLALDEGPQGAFGEVDVVLPAPGSITVNLATVGIPAGTTVEVTAKERRGGGLVSSLAPLAIGNCDGTGACQAATSLNLAAGIYVLEARATFQP